MRLRVSASNTLTPPGLGPRRTTIPCPWSPNSIAFPSTSRPIWFFILSARNASRTLRKTSPSPNSFRQPPPQHLPWRRSHTSRLRLLYNHLRHSPTYLRNSLYLLYPSRPLRPPQPPPTRRQTSLVGTAHGLKAVPSAPTLGTASVPVPWQRNTSTLIVLRSSTVTSISQLASLSRM